MNAYHLHILTGDPIHPDQARQLTASLLDKDQSGAVASLMNYDPATGKTITAFPPVHFGYNRKGFSLIGYGEPGSQLVQDMAGKIVLAWSERLDKPVMVEGRNLCCAIERESYPVTYRVPRMVLQKRAEHLVTLKDPVAGKAFIEKLFLSSITRQAEHLGLAMPKDIQVEFIGCGSEFAAQNGKGSPACLGIRQAVFKANLRLCGLWSVGRLLSKGYGLMNCDLQRGEAEKGDSHALPQ